MVHSFRDSQSRLKDHRGTGWSAAVPSCSRPIGHLLHVFLRLELLFPQIGLVWHFSEKEGGWCGRCWNHICFRCPSMKAPFFRQGWSFDAYTAYAWVFLWEAKFHSKGPAPTWWPNTGWFFWLVTAGQGVALPSSCCQHSKLFLPKSALESYCLFWVCKWICLPIF